MKTHRKAFLLLFLFVTISGYGQKNAMTREVEKIKSQAIRFENQSSIIHSTVEKVNLADGFKKPEEVVVFDYVPSKTKSTFSQALRLDIPTKNEMMELELIEVPETFFDYEVVTESGERYPPNRNIKNYHGVVKGDSTSVVALTFTDQEMMGFISTREGNFNVGLNRQLNKHILYHENNLKEKMEFNCGTPTDYSLVYDPETLLGGEQIAPMALINQKYVRIYFETEHDMFQARGSVAAVEQYVVSVFNQVATLYLNESVLLAISEIRVWTTADPYHATTTEALIKEFQNTRTSINGDVGQLLTFRDLDGGRAVLNGLCNSQTKNKLGVCRMRNLIINNYPNYTWSVYVVAHELGHLLGSQHTHACVWNGNNTAIDGCEEPEGGCSRPGVPANGGTIMSYCHTEGNPGVNFSLGFGLQPGNVIRNKVNMSTCLQTRSNILGSSLVTTTGTTYTLSSGTASGWTCSNNLVLVSSNSTSATFRSVGKGLAWIEARLNIGVAGVRAREEVWSGPPVITGVTGPSSTPNYQYATYRAVYNEKSLASGFQWILNPQNGNSVYGGGPSCDIAFYNEGSYQLLVRASNANGMSDYFSSGMRVYNASSYGYSFFPNPTSDILYVVLSEHVFPTRLSDGVLPVGAIQYDIRLYDGQGKIVRRTSSKGGQIEWSVSDLPEGTYYLHVYDNVSNTPEKQQVLIRR